MTCWVLVCFAGFTWLACLRPFSSHVLGVLTCVACFIKWRAWRASPNGVLGVLQKIGVLLKIDMLGVLNIYEMFS